MDADTPTSPPSPPHHLRKKAHSQLHNGIGPQEEVDQISQAYSNPPSARDPDPLPHSESKGEWHNYSNPNADAHKISKIPPISQVKSSSDPNRINKALLGVGKKLSSPLKHDNLQSEYDDRHAPGHGTDFELEESDDFHRKPKQHRQLSNVASGGALLRKKPQGGLGSPLYSDDAADESSDQVGDVRPHPMNRKPKAPALIFPSESEGKIAPSAKGIRQGGLSQITNPTGGGNKVSRVPPSKGGRGVIQNEERWMEGGAGAAPAPLTSATNDNDAKYQPTTPRGQKSHQRGSYESKFDRDRRSHQHRPHPSLSSQSDDGLEVLDDISESYDDHQISSAMVGDDDQSIMSDISLEKAGVGEIGSPGLENHFREQQQSGMRTRLKKQQKNSVLGKLNKNKVRIDPIEESSGSVANGPTPSPSVSDLQIAPSQVPPGMMIPAQMQQQQQPLPRSVRQVKPGAR